MCKNGRQELERLSFQVNEYRQRLQESEKWQTEAMASFRRQMREREEQVRAELSESVVLMEVELAAARRLIEELQADLAAERSGVAAKARRAALRDAILGDAPRHTRFARSVAAAVKRDKEWTLDSSTYNDLVSSPCHYCGGSTGDNIGLDRIDNRMGYTEDNVVPCCGACNYRRGLKSYERFVQAT